MSNQDTVHRIISCLMVFGMMLFPATKNMSQELGRLKPGPGITSTTTPIIAGFNPDPSVCRVGNDYYLVTSSNEYFPGLPIYHSRNLSDWKMIGHVLRDPAMLDLDSVPCSNGLYAPTIRHHNGMFYVVCTLTGTLPGKPRGNFVTMAKDPRGPWSSPVWIDAPGIDPSLFFDIDGKVYYHGNYTPEQKSWPRHRNVFVQEIDPRDWKLTGPRVDILNAADHHLKGGIDGGIEAGVDYLEAPHIYRKDNYYYMLVSHGGTFQNHAVSIWRSRNVFGPYETNPANPILTHRALPPTHPVTSTGHGDLVQSNDGGWHLVFLARRPFGEDVHILGRETFLTGIDWSGAWPVLSPDDKGRTPAGRMPPRESAARSVKKRIEAFRDPTLSPEWTFIRTPREQWWSTTIRRGSLFMNLKPERLSEISQPTFIGRRLDRINADIHTRMVFEPRQAGEEAGLVVLRDKDHYFRFTIARDKDGKYLQLIRRDILLGADSLIRRIPISQQRIHLQISMTGSTYSFRYGKYRTRMKYFRQGVDGSFLGAATAGRFTGTMIGMYASSNGSTSVNKTRFDWLKH